MKRPDIEWMKNRVCNHSDVGICVICQHEPLCEGVRALELFIQNLMKAAGVGFTYAEDFHEARRLIGERE